MNKPLVSIILPIATNSPFLATTLMSLNSQDYGNTEFVIIVNFNDDHNIAEVQRILKERLVKIVMVDSSYNLSQRLNKGIEKSTGSYIARADADDSYPVNRISSQLEFLINADSELAIVSGQGNLIDSQGSIFGQIVVPESYESVERILLFKNCVIHPAVMMRREPALEFRYNPDLKTGEDYDLWLRIGSKYKIANLGLTVINYRVHSENMSNKRIPTKILMVLAARKWQYGKERNFAYPLILIAVVSWSIKNFFFGPQFLVQIRRKIANCFF